jgi:hypothetical protein
MLKSSAETVKFKQGGDSNADSDGHLIRDESSRDETHLKVQHSLQSSQTVVVFRKCVFEGQKSVLKTEAIKAGC